MGRSDKDRPLFFWNAQMKLLTLLTLLFVSQYSLAEVVHLSSATWTGCGKRGCYKLFAEKGGVSSFIPKNLFVKNIHLALYKQRNQKTPYMEVIADHGFWMDDEKKWVLVKGHQPKSSKTEDYYFLADQIVLAKAKM